MEILILLILVLGFIGLAIYLKSPKIDLKILEEKDNKIVYTEKEIVLKETKLNNLEREIAVLIAKTESFEKIKTEKTQIEERLKQIENERNFLKNDNIKYQKSEESRQKETTKSIAATITLQESLEKEKERLNDERVQEKESYLNEMKLTWSKHEKDVQNHLQSICKNNIIKYISQEEFPHDRN